MYISHLKITNIRCLEGVPLELYNENNPVLWTTVLGDNAVGKSTFLKSIAMGLCDEATAAALMKEPSGDFLREGETLGCIEITLKKETGPEYRITTNISKATLSSPEKVEQTTYPKDHFPWKDVFVCAYGVSRLGSNGSSYEKYDRLEAVYSLFKPSSELMNPELILRRQEEDLRIKLTDILLRVLMLDKRKYSIEFTPKGMEVRGPWGSFPIGQLSDGYLSTTNWLVDFFAWQIYADRINESTEFNGIILLDELENHLHPKWQAKIRSLLRKEFPRVQFITTTHSPLIAASAQLSSRDCDSSEKLVHFALTENNIVRKTELAPLTGLDIDQVLASKAFDYFISADPEVEKILAAASELAGKGTNRTREEESRYKEIKLALKDILKPSGRTLIERETQTEIYEEMKKNIRDLEHKLFGGRQ